MCLKKLLHNNRQRINQELPDIEQRKFISPALYILTQKILKSLETNATGRLIDVGCGDMPFKNHIPQAVTQYDTLDVEESTGGITYIGDILDMSMIHSETYDSAICLEVLEHIKNPFIAIKEINRILKKEGLLIISVPHMWPIHEAPHDYFRFTNFGLKHVLEENQFEILSLEISGGVLSYFGHNISLLLLCLFWRVPAIKQLIFFCVKWLIVLPWGFIDDKIIKSQTAPLEYLCVARKITSHS